MSISANSSPSLTAEQRAPMSVENANVALAAGAGCGKTTVLTERFVALLEGEKPKRLDQIVALTFTEKAARELRNRVRIACRERLERGEDPARWRNVLRGLETARIGTFHAFCGTILRRYPVESGVDPGFEILDESLAPTVRDEALDACLRRWLSSRDPDLAALAVDHGLTAIKQALSDFLADRPDVDLDAWASREPAEIVARWERFRDETAAPELLARFAADQGTLLDLLANEECSHEVMKSRCAFLRAEIPRIGESTNPVASLAEIREHAKVQGGGKKEHWSSPEVYEKVKVLLEGLRAGVKALLPMLEPDGGRSLASAEAGGRFARLARDAVAVYARVKADAGVLDFDDLQSRVRNLLQSGPASVREDLTQSIGALLVDEFQDTDAVQAEILGCLAGSDPGSGRMFLVGDEKQSIYRFRGAQPAIFQSFRKKFLDAGRLNLTENFRSLPEILVFVNALFAETFPGDEHALKPGATIAEPLTTTRRSVEIHLSGTPATKPDSATKRKAEAASIARLLSTRLAEGWTIRDRGSKRPRDAEPGDVALLFRSRSDFPTYEQALAAEGLDYHVVGGSTYFAQQEVIDLINLLSTIEDPLDPLALAGTLRGPFFGVSDEGLFWLATDGEADLPTTFRHWRRVEQSLAKDDRRAVERASLLLDRWRARKDRVSIADLLNGALEESGFEAALFGEFLGDRKRANVRKLVRLAKKFDRRGSFTLADFVARLRADVRTPPREEQASTTDEQGQAVRLMTVHQAKGLEFPIVVLADLDRKPPNESALVVSHPELGILVRAAGADESDELPTWSLGRTLRDRIELLAEREEALRVFYVATTRARDHLILSAGMTAEDRPASPVMQLLAERFDLGTGACRNSLPDGWPIPSVGIINDTESAPSTQVKKARFRPKLLMAARQITTAHPPFEDEERTYPKRPARWRDLDPPPHSDQDVWRLFRIGLADPAACGDEPAFDLIGRVAEARGLWCTDRGRTVAAEALTRWRASRVCRSVARASEVRRGIRWTLAWPCGEPRPTAYSGRIDFACRDVAGRWNLVCASRQLDDGARDREFLNLHLSALAAKAHRIEPVVAAWIVDLASGAEICIREFDDRALRRAASVFLP